MGYPWKYYLCLAILCIVIFWGTFAVGGRLTINTEPENRLNIKKTVHKYSISLDMKVSGPEFHPRPISGLSKHGDHDSESFEDFGEGSVKLNGQNFDRYGHEYSILVVDFFAPWCHWSQSLKPSWEKAAKTLRERYDPEMDKRILLGKVDCTEEPDLCRRHHIYAYPSIRIFRKGNDVREDHGPHEHESYQGQRDVASLVAAMEALVAPLPLALEDKSGSKNETKRPAAKTGARRGKGFERVKEAMEALVPPLPLALEDKLGSKKETKRPAPKTGARRGEGFVPVKEVNTGHKDDMMQSSFLGETLKYFYLLFSPLDTIPLDQ